MSSCFRNQHTNKLQKTNVRNLSNLHEEVLYNSSSPCLLALPKSLTRRKEKKSLSFSYTLHLPTRPTKSTLHRSNTKSKSFPQHSLYLSISLSYYLAQSHNNQEVYNRIGGHQRAWRGLKKSFLLPRNLLNKNWYVRLQEEIHFPAQNKRIAGKNNSHHHRKQTSTITSLSSIHFQSTKLISQPDLNLNPSSVCTPN
jgi:hypothetical protein